ncbi:hypothetical protein MASR2M17_18910 [Aminivibrio sp.]
MAGIGLMLVIIFLQVISRYFFGHASYSEELSRYLRLRGVFLSLVVSRQGGHMAVGLLRAVHREN